ncbi:hypothetical protein N8300_02470 [Pelagibacteraceae bacterium]|nr:hypothetical protein [Pelagibacteraceae bacterium]
MNFSLTIFAGILFILSYFLLFYFKKFNIYQKLAIIILLLAVSLGLSKNSNQVDKLVNLIKIDNWNILDKEIKLLDNPVKLNNQKNKVKDKVKDKVKVKELDLIIKENKTDKKESLVLDIISTIAKPSDRKGQTETNILNIVPNLKQKIDEKDLILDKKFKEKIKKSSIDTSRKPKNLSSEVYIVSLNIAKLSFLENPLGFGLNNYHLAFRNFINEIIVTNKMTQKLNFMDGSNNFSKLIAEFGIFSIIIFYIIFNFLFSKKISFEHKFLIFPALFTQTFIRGAGYFNGGWILFLVLAFYLIYKSKE